MAVVQITISDIDVTNIGVDVAANPMFPESALLYTNAQMIAREIINNLQNLSKQVNDSKHQQLLTS